ncbi:DedA family protein [Lyticum sinuosum]|uniref:DedA family protein n=1 Tax=Lyticum sinuosum TaxID=1332059 RepID=A0AAE5AHS9_9RICK|nr:DedA family protein [Lyticum sinuosum]MDZ5761508.1 DedA family protein [Lyticum sinuosum]
MNELLLYIVDLVEKMGYIGIFLMTFIEGTLIPIPNEITLIPAGFLVSKGEFNFWILLIISAAGNVMGSMTSYYVAFKYGRNALLRYGKYFFFDDKKMQKMESFFQKHGPFSVFIGRIAPGIKHFISFPPGLAQMDFKKFFIYSSLGGTLWVLILILIGITIGNNQDLINYYVEKMNYIIFFLVIFVIIFYIRYNKIKKNNQ